MGCCQMDALHNRNRLAVNHSTDGIICASELIVIRYSDLLDHLFQESLTCLLVLTSQTSIEVSVCFP